jgi:hypothetical protein
MPNERGGGLPRTVLVIGNDAVTRLGVVAMLEPLVQLLFRAAPQ